MANKKHEFAAASDRLFVQFVLRAGLGAAIALMLAGIALKFAHGHYNNPSVTMVDLFGRGLALSDRLMGLGILVLAFTPAVRVLMLVVLWTRERDWRFVGVALTVVVVLAVAISLGGG